MKNISLGGASPPTSPRGSDSESDSEEKRRNAKDKAEMDVRLQLFKAEMAKEKAAAAAEKKATAEKAARDQKSQREKDHKKNHKKKHLPFALKTHRLEMSHWANPEKKALRMAARGKRHKRKSTFPNVVLPRDVNPYFCYNNIFNKNTLQHAFKYINVLILIC